MKQVDWTKSHCGVFLCTVEETKRLMPEITEILEDLTNSGKLQYNEDDYYVDVKVHKLMPNQFPCIPNWHCDFVPRDHDGNRMPEKIGTDKMYLWVSGEPKTEWKFPERTNRFTTPEGLEWVEFNQRDLHRGVVSTIHTWRCFIRLIPKSFVHPNTYNMGEIRRHTQVYLDSDNFKW